MPIVEEENNKDNLHCCMAFLDRNTDTLPVKQRQWFRFWWHLRSFPCQSSAAALYLISSVAFPWNEFSRIQCVTWRGQGILNFIKIISKTFVEERAWRKERNQHAINENIRFIAEWHISCKENTKNRKKWFLGFWFLWPLELICSREKGANIFVLFGG